MLDQCPKYELLLAFARLNFTLGVAPRSKAPGSFVCIGFCTTLVDLMERRLRTPIVRFAVRRGSVWFDLAPPSTIVLVILLGRAKLAWAVLTKSTAPACPLAFWL